MIFKNKGLEVYIYKDAIDMRCGFQKLTGFAKSAYSMKTILQGHVFVFFGTNRRRIKILYFDGTGLLLLTKRLEQGRFMWIKDIDYTSVTFSELEQLLHGSVLIRSRLGVMPKSKKSA